MYEARLEEKDDFPFCLVLEEGSSCSRADKGKKKAGTARDRPLLQVQVESRNINTSSRKFDLTSATLLAAAAPPLIDWDAVRKMSRQKQVQAGRQGAGASECSHVTVFTNL